MYVRVTRKTMLMMIMFAGTCLLRAQKEPNNRIIKESTNYITSINRARIGLFTCLEVYQSGF